MAQRRDTRLFHAVLALCALTAITASAAQAGPVRVAGVPAPALAQAHASTTPASRGLRLHIAVALRPRDPAALAAEVRAVSTPGSPRYGRYLTPGRFAARYGAAPGAIRTVRAALRARGLHPGPTSAGGLSIPVTATAAALSRGLEVSLAQAGPRARDAVIATRAPALPAAAARRVQAIIGLDTATHPRALALRGRRGVTPATPASAALPETPATPVEGPQACATAAADAPVLNAYTDDQVADAYGFDGLYAAGDDGTGTTVAVYELEPDDPGDIAAFQACYGTHAPVSYVHVDGRGRRRPGQRRGGLRHREPRCLRARGPGARLPGAQRQLRHPRLGPLRHLQRDRQPGPRPGRHRLVGRVRGPARRRLGPCRERAL